MNKVNLRPSAGFLLLVSSYVLLGITLAWGASTPELDRVWKIMQGMQRREFAELTSKDISTLKGALQHYPTLPRAFIGKATLGFIEPTHDGWMSIIRPHIVTGAHSQSSITLDVECEALPSAFPVAVTLEREAGRQALRFDESGHQRIELHFAQPAKPELVPLVITPAGRNPQKQAPRIRLTVQEHPSHMVSP